MMINAWTYYKEILNKQVPEQESNRDRTIRELTESVEAEPNTE